MKAHGKSVNELKEQVNELESLKAQNEDLNKQLSDRDKQLEELKKVDAEGLQAKIDELQQANETTKTEYEQKLQQQAFDYRLESTLSGAKVKNTKAIKALLDMDMIKLDGDTLKGLDTQLESLKESDPYLFDQEEQQEQNQPGFKVGGDGVGNAVSKAEVDQWIDAF